MAISSLDDTVAAGQSGHVADHQAIHRYLRNTDGEQGEFVKRVWLPPYNAAGDYWLHATDEVNSSPTDDYDAIMAADADLDNEVGGFILLEPGKAYYIDSTTTNDTGEDVGLLFAGPNKYLMTEHAPVIMGGSNQSGNPEKANHGAQATLVWDRTTGTIPDHLVQMELATGVSNADHRGGGVIGVGFKDLSPSRNQISTLFDYRGGNRGVISGCLFGDLNKAGSRCARIRPQGDQWGGSQATQYNHVMFNEFHTAYNALDLLDAIPDTIVSYNYFEASTDQNPNAGATGVYTDGNAVLIENNRFLFWDLAVHVDGSTTNDGKHINIIFNHFEGISTASTGAYEAAIKLEGGSGVENPHVIGNELGNAAKYTDFINCDSSMGTLYMAANRRRGSSGTSSIFQPGDSLVTVPTGTLYPTLTAHS